MRFAFKESKNLAGFTLIELLVVISIIGILSSIILVSLDSAKRRAYRAAALSAVSGAGTEIIICQNDQLTVVGQLNRITGDGRICRGGGGNVNVISHTVTWPTLITTGYCYSRAWNACAPINNNAPLPNIFYLYDSDNILITCTWSNANNLICR